MLFEVIRRGWQFFMKLPNNVLYQIISFFWNYFMPGILLGLLVVKGSFLFPLSAIPVILRLETTED